MLKKKLAPFKLVFFVILIGLLLRLIVFGFFHDQPLTIVDEQHYQAIARNIVTHHEFSLNTGHPTSIRPPLYPAFLSIVYSIIDSINAVRLIQILLSLGIIVMTFLLGRKMFDTRTGLLAALIIAVYPSFIFFTHFILTEILFTLLFLIFLWCFIQVLTPGFFKGNTLVFLSGLFLGLCALTRSILYPFLPFALICILVMTRVNLKQKLAWVLLLTFGYSIAVGPWAIRNSLLQKSPVIIDTMGGLNLYMGNYEHTPLNRSWAAVDLTGEKTWYYGHEKILMPMNEAQKQKWASEKAKAFMLEHRGLTLKRSLIKAANFWGIERTVTGGIINGQWPELNTKPYLVTITGLIILVYCSVMISAVPGIFFNLRPGRPDIILIVFLLFYFTGMHAVVFGHARYHLPLIPVLGIFASWGILHFKEVIRKKKTWPFRLTVACSCLLVFIWVREILFIDGARFLDQFF